MADRSPYTVQHHKLAVNLAALLGWGVIVTPIALSGNPFGLLWSAAVGLPIAFLACWGIAAPLMRRLMQHRVSWLRAGLWGAGIAAIFAAIGIAVTRFWGWRQSMDPDIHSRIGPDHRIRSVDGILTYHGWIDLAQSTAMFVLMGAAIALLVRAVIGPGRTPAAAPTDTPAVNKA